MTLKIFMNFKNMEAISLKIKKNQKFIQKINLTRFNIQI